MSKTITVTFPESMVSKLETQGKASALTITAEVSIIAETRAPANLTVAANVPVVAETPAAAYFPAVFKVPVAEELPAFVEATVSTEAPFYILPDTLRNWPYESNISPYYRAVQAESIGWIENFHPFSSAAQKAFNSGNFGLLVALTFPKATHYDLRSCCDMMQTFFTLDDHTDLCDTKGARWNCEATMDAMLHPDKPRPQVEPVIGEIARQFWKRAFTYAPQAAKERFIKAWRSYLDSVIFQAQRRDDSRYICTIEEYMIARRDNVGSGPIFAFLEVSLGLDIPHYVMEHPYIVALIRDASDMTVLANDMCSYRKEVLCNAADYNAVTVVMQRNNTDVAGGIQWISDTHDDIAEHFLKLRDDVHAKQGFPSFGENLDWQIAASIDGLGQWVRGNDEWNFGSERYFGDKGLEIQKTRKVIIA